MKHTRATDHLASVGSMRRFLQELKRRKVYRVGVAYLAAAFVVIQLADLAAGAFGLPSWFEPMVWVVCGLGFPLALVLAWGFELTPEGVRRETTPEESDGPSTGPVATGVVGMGMVLLAAVGGTLYLIAGEDEPGAPAPDRSIAVLPFTNLSGTEDAEPYVNGIHDDLLARLSNISDLKVISRTSVMRYRDAQLPIPAIADSLGVAWVLEGGVQKLGDGIQVNAQLIDPRSDTHAWADTYRRDLTAENVFALQSEITKRIARSLEAELSTAEEGRVERPLTDDLDAYRLYVEARSQMDPRTEDGLRTSIHLFEQALAQDSSFALAWSGLADAHTLLASMGIGDRRSLTTEASRAARRALESDSTLAEAHASMGLIRYIEHDGPGALRWLENAVELRPSYLRAQHWLGLALLMLGRSHRSVEHLERAVELDPMSAPIRASLAIALSYVDRFEGALDQCQRWEALEPRSSAPIQYKGRLLLALGRTRESIAVSRHVLEDLQPTPLVAGWARAWLVVAHHETGDTARARQILSRLREMEGVPVAKAAAHAGLGEDDEAVSLLQAERGVDAAMRTLRYDPVFATLRDDPWVRKLIRDFNVSWGLNPDGSLPDSVDVSFGPPGGRR